MKTIIYIFIITVLLSSCSGSKFLNRKYTQGRFVENSKSLKHNSTKTDVTKSYTSLNSKIDLQKTVTVSETEIINARVNSIVKKDSIFHIKKKGKDEIIRIKNNLPDVHVIIDERTGKKTTLNPQVINEQKRNAFEYELKKAKRTTWASLSLCLIPVVGFLLSIKARRSIKKIKSDKPELDLSKYYNIATASLVVSIIPLVAAILLALFIIVLIIALIMWKPS